MIQYILQSNLHDPDQVFWLHIAYIIGSMILSAAIGAGISMLPTAPRRVATVATVCAFGWMMFEVCASYRVSVWNASPDIVWSMTFFAVGLQLTKPALWEYLSRPRLMEVEGQWVYVQPTGWEYQYEAIYWCGARLRRLASGLGEMVRRRPQEYGSVPDLGWASKAKGWFNRVVRRQAAATA